MPVDHGGSSSNSNSPTLSRPKPARANTALGTVRPRQSPPGGEQANDGRPPTKRARKAINCEPCRNSKLKCDRNRPCSSCVLRGTAAMCYADGRHGDASEPYPTRVDAAQEIARLRHSINLLEAHIFPRGNQGNSRSDAPHLVPKKEMIDVELRDKSHAPGLLANVGFGGLYSGSTSLASHLIDNEARSPGDASEIRHDSPDHDDVTTVEYDRDLLAMLPPVDVIDNLINFYFDYCCWVYRFLNQATFTQAWSKYKGGGFSDRLVLATACTVLAVAVLCLPQQHQLLRDFHESREELATRFIGVSKSALNRRQVETGTYTIELVELYLLRCHYLTLHKGDSEEIWSLRGKLLTIGTAMGLHRDPGTFNMHRDVAERRRWAWWHIMLIERWQAFVFGRPLGISAHHFDTQLPSYCDPIVDPSGRLYLPNIAFFKLIFILGNIVDDALAVRPVSYDSVTANDLALTQWLDNLPPEFDLDEYTIARNLTSADPVLRRLGLQTVLLRTMYLHLRFSLHRAHATAAISPPDPNRTTKVTPNDTSNNNNSLEIAVSSAEKLINMVSQALHASSSLPGHMHWISYHLFSGAMFFTFQTIADPNGPNANHYRSNVLKAVSVLETCRGSSVADKSYTILQTLAPLYSPEFAHEEMESRERKQTAILRNVRKMAFPYQNYQRNFGSPRTLPTHSSPGNSSSVSPVAPLSNSLPQSIYYDRQNHSLPPTSSLRSSTNASSNSNYTLSHPSAHQSPHVSPTLSHPPMNVPLGGSSPYPQQYQLASQQQRLYNSSSSTPRYPAPSTPIDDSMNWGTPSGLGTPEWMLTTAGTNRAS